MDAFTHLSPQVLSATTGGVRSDQAFWKKLNQRRRLFLLAGPCVVESEDLCLGIAETLKKACERREILYVFKASFDKANRSSSRSFRGPGIEEGLAVLARVRNEIGVKIVTDVHSEEQVRAAAEVADVLQIPAFLCRQTDLITAAVKTGKVVNIKKGQFLSPYDMANVVQKAVDQGGTKILLTERGTTFGYNNLVVDMRGIPIMKRLGFPVVMDSTHSVQLPGGAGDKSSGQSEFAPVLARAAIASGADGLFVETHPEPKNALSDGPNMIPLKNMPKLLDQWQKMHDLVQS